MRVAGRETAVAALSPREEIVMHDHDAVARCVHVYLDAVGPVVRRREHRADRVLRMGRARSAMGNGFDHVGEHTRPAGSLTIAATRRPTIHRDELSANIP